MAERSSADRVKVVPATPVRRLRGPPWRWIDRRFPGSIQGILLLVLMVVLVPVLLTQAAIYKRRLDARRAQEFQANLELARSVAGIFDAYVHDVLHQELAIGLDLTEPRPLSPDQIKQILLPNTREYPTVRAFAWVDPQGQVVASSRLGATQLDVHAVDYFRQIASGREWSVSDLMRSTIDEEPIFVIARGIRDTNGTLRGVVIAVVDPRRLGGRLMVTRGGQGAVSIVDHRGWGVYHYPEVDLPWEQRDWLGSEPILATALNGQEVTGTYRSPIDGQTRIGGLTPIHSIGWVASADRPEAEVLTSDLGDFVGSFALLLAVGIVAFLVALRTGRTLVVPIERLREYALAVGQGDFDRRIEVAGPRELKELADAFNRMAAEIRAHEAMREEYVHTVSHDLRSPLTIIQGHAHLLESILGEERSAEPAGRSVAAILKGVRRMNAMIRDLIDSARLDAQQLQMNPEPVDLGAFVLDLQERLVGVNGAQRIRLDLPAGLPQVLADPDRLERILLNLLTNAIRYADPDTPILVALTRGDDEVIASVIDRGRGIPPEDLGQLFQRFHRTKSSENHRDSIGLGLYITKRLVEASGGRIWAESEIGRGSAFSVALPLADSTQLTHESG